jgi:hypothetical protein
MSIQIIRPCRINRPCGCVVRLRDGRGRRALESERTCLLDRRDIDAEAQLKRTIEIADFDLPRGPITIAKLLEMSPETWGHLRTEISRQRHIDASKPLARCRLCRGAVYIRSSKLGEDHAPLFAHYSGAPEDCPWYHGDNLIPDDARAAQYKGHQESAYHRWICETIAELIGKDLRCRRVTVDTYLRPYIHARGRYPDIYAEIDDLGRFAIEVQLAKPFATEIIARQLHYEAEGVALLWVFANLDPDLPQGFRDVITTQRGNAFLFDDAAFEASISSNTLQLTCLLENNKHGWLAPRLVKLDELNTKSGRATFIEDRRTKRLNEYCKDGRIKWWNAFLSSPAENARSPNNKQKFMSAWDSIVKFVPIISAWQNDLWNSDYIKGKEIFIELAAILFSITHTAKKGEEILYITNYKGEGRLVAMLNSKLNSTNIQPYSNLLETAINNSRAAIHLQRSSLRTAFERARNLRKQIDTNHPVWKACARIFPESLDGLIRAELIDLGSLPDWAQPEVS